MERAIEFYSYTGELIRIKYPQRIFTDIIELKKAIERFVDESIIRVYFGNEEKLLAKDYFRAIDALMEDGDPEKKIYFGMIKRKLWKLRFTFVKGHPRRLPKHI